MSRITVTHSWSEDGLALSSVATDGTNEVASKVSWKTTEEAERNTQNAMESFEALAVKKLAAAVTNSASVRGSGKRVNTPWGEFFVGYTLGGAYDPLVLPRVKINREKRRVALGWIKGTVFVRKTIQR